MNDDVIWRGSQPSIINLVQPRSSASELDGCTGAGERNVYLERYTVGTCRREIRGKMLELDLVPHEITRKLETHQVRYQV